MKKQHKGSNTHQDIVQTCLHFYSKLIPPSNLFNGHAGACTGTKVRANGQKRVCVGPFISALVLAKSDNKIMEQSVITTVMVALPLNSTIPTVCFSPFPCSFLKWQVQDIFGRCASLSCVSGASLQLNRMHQKQRR